MSTKAEKEHLNRVASLGCCVRIKGLRCDSPANCHHIRSGVGMGRKSSHFETLPLCHYHHQGDEGIHTIGIKTWQAKYGAERELLQQTMEELGYDR